MANVATEARQNLEKIYYEKRAEDFLKNRDKTVQSSRMMKTLGFVTAFASYAAVVFGHAYAPLIHADNVKRVAQGAVALGKAGVKVGAALFGIGALREIYNTHKRP